MADAESQLSFPRLRARTQRFTLGEPRSLTLCAKGSRLLFLRSAAGDDPRTGLWAMNLPDGDERPVVAPPGSEQLTAAERARRERTRESAQGVTSYAADDAGRVIAVVLDGLLHVVDGDSGTVTSIAETRGCFDPRPDPTGRRIAYVADGRLHIVDLDARTPRQLAADDHPDVSWGRAEFIAAEEFDRYRGFWWAPDGESLLAARVDETPVQSWWISDPAHPDREPVAIRYPAAGTPNAEVTLWWIAADGSDRRQVRWDRAEFPYVGRVSWSSAGPPLVHVLRRDQTASRVLTVDTATGETSIAAADTSSAWVDLAPNAPCWYEGKLVRVADRDGVRGLVVGDEVVSGDRYVRTVVGTTEAGIVFTASPTDDPTSVAVYRWSDSEPEILTDPVGVHGAVAAGSALVITAAELGRAGTQTVVHLAGRGTRALSSHALVPPVVPQVRMLQLGPRRLRSGLLLPRNHRPGTPLPVLLDPYGGPGAQRVLSAQRMWLEPQWLADQGFAVLVTDGRGSPGRSPAWEHEIRHDFATKVLDDQVDALHAVAELEPDLDLSRVGIRGWSFGGYLAALAVLRRPDIFHAAIAGAPVTDWTLYDTGYTERYLGTPQAQPEAYAVSSIVSEAPSLSRPLLLIHGLADDNVVAAHTLRFSQRLTEAGRAHELIALTGVTHMTPQEAVAENLLLLQIDFFQRTLVTTGRTNEH